MLRTKLNRPPINKEHVFRSNLVERLENNIHKPLTLVSAPAGYGKSMLISSWIEEKKHQCAWISLSEDEDEMILFLNYLYSSIDSIFPASLEKTSNLIKGSKLPEEKELAHVIINELDQIDTAFVVVLDDYHFIHDKKIRELINDIIKFPPENLHLIIITRTDPSLNLSNLRAHQLLTEIRMLDLAFNNIEIAELFKKTHGAELVDSELKVLAESTEGWVAGLALISMAFNNLAEEQQILKTLQKSGFIVSDFLFEEVLLKQPAHFQKALIASSVLSRFTPELIDRIQNVFKSGDEEDYSGENFIKWLINSNLFTIALDQEMQWFRYHHLFRDLLKRQLPISLTEEQITSIHLIAAEYNSQNGFLNDSFNHYLKVKDYENAIDIIVKYGHLNFLDGAIEIGLWINKIPESIRDNNPDLLLMSAWAAFGRFQLEKIPPILDKVNILLEGKKQDPLQKATLDFFKGNFFYWMGDTNASIQTLTEGLSHKDDLPVHVLCNLELIINMARQRNGEDENLIYEINEKLNIINPKRIYYIAYTYGSLSFVHLLSGKLVQGKEVAYRMQLHSSKNNIRYLLAWSYYFQGLATMELYNLEEAIAHFHETYEKRYSIDTRASLDALAGLALLQQFKNQPLLANSAMQLLMKFAMDTDDPQNIIIAQSSQARINILQGNINEALLWANSFNVPPMFAGMFVWLEVPWITQAKVWLADGSEDSIGKATPLLDELLSICESSHLTFHLIEVKVLLSLALEKSGQNERAITLLQEVVQLSAPLDFSRPYIEIGEPIMGLLQNLKGQGIAQGFIEKVESLISFQQDQTSMEENELNDHKSIAKVASLNNLGINSLTSREEETLTLLASGLHNKEIADKMFVSVDAVKKNLYRIFQKFNVKSRIQLVNRAKELGILAE